MRATVLSLKVKSGSKLANELAPNLKFRSSVASMAGRVGGAAHTAEA